MNIPAFLQNPLVIGSLGLSAGSVIGYFRSAPKAAGNLFQRFFTCSIQVSNMDDEETFHVTRKWMSSLDYAKRTRNLTGLLADGNWVLTPAPGNHFFWFEGRPVWLHRERGNVQSDLKNMALKFPETITIRAMTRNKDVIERLCEKIKSFSQSLGTPEGHMKIYTVYYSSWEGRVRMGRPLESVVLPEGEMERVKSDLEKFWNSEEWYHKMGIPYRRGWLFQGVPGSGKTSLVSALAGHYKKNVYILNLSDPDLSDTKMLSLLSCVKNGSIILLEDIDAAFNRREQKDAQGITFSGLLNALDGVASPDGTVVIMTTNHPEKLDPALVRPGRIDQVMDFGAATDEQLSRLYKRFTGGSHPEGFVQYMKGKTVAQAQEYLLRLAA